MGSTGLCGINGACIGIGVEVKAGNYTRWLPDQLGTMMGYV